MSYTPTNWIDGETPVNAAKMNNIEAGISANSTAIDEINTARANGEFKGEPGLTGPQGPSGKSAYQYAQDGGYTGTEAEFTQKLAQETAGSGIHIGTDAPTDENVNVWIDTDEEAEASEPIQSDWNAAEGEPGHVLNRTHWVDVEKNKVFLDTTFPASTIQNGMVMLALNGELEAGHIYTVTFMGQEYSCECKYGMVNAMLALCLGNPAAYGGEPTEEPFAIGHVQSLNMTAIIPFVQVAEYSVKIEGDANTYHPISSKLLPRPIWLIDFDSLLDNPSVSVTQIELNRAIDNGEMIALRDSPAGSQVVNLMYFSTRYSDGRVVFASTHYHPTGTTIGNVGWVLIPNDSGGYDMSETLS